LVVHPQLTQVLKHTLLNQEQVNHPEKMNVKWPAGALSGYKPFGYENGLHAIAPGVVLIASPGHTPGSQMVFVERADGAEFLFIGDVSWQMRNIEQVRERPRFVTMAMGENRDQVWALLAGLHEVMHEARLHIVPGHDGVAIDELIHSKLLVPGFK
jgi:glyoxylase-like metal-dependent hydrolase (beta-lactamase superfamily II)